ncbi:hypothetical protein HanXRQr2_Chr13g0589571 [Helianthus annuus]|uniref:Uncharacterized protein n=1 Tax=Helianthus annuus TaxID=4232 RepID=A0A9K3EI60_HELAN|nr:hypothetical protein HanXRQr2_Chr13g0589571 [Helianthus annuus]
MSHLLAPLITHHPPTLQQPLSAIYISKMKIMYGNEDLEQQEVKTARIFPFINSIREC